MKGLVLHQLHKVSLKYNTRSLSEAGLIGDDWIRLSEG